MDLDLPVDPNEPTYCFCNQVSYGEMVACDNPDVSNPSFFFIIVLGLKFFFTFCTYNLMKAHFLFQQCKIEWFHFGCVGLKEQPKGKWYCSDCAVVKNRRKGR